MIDWILIYTVRQPVSQTQAAYTNPVTLLSCHNYSSMLTKHVRQHVKFMFGIVGDKQRGPTESSMGGH